MKEIKHKILAQPAGDRPRSRVALAAAKAQCRYTAAVADEICDRLAHGQSIRAICGDKGMPCWTTVRRWLLSRPAFRAAYARAREDQADWLAAEALDRARAVRSTTATSTRVLLGELHWQAARLKPKVYGERSEAAADAGEPVDVAARLRQALDRSPATDRSAAATASVDAGDVGTQEGGDHDAG